MIKKISLISPCYNEEDNIQELYRRVTAVIDSMPQYDFEYLIIDNASTDTSESKLKLLASTDKRIKLIFNNRNFGHIRSPYWGLLQTSGAATVYLASDMQDPPELIPEFIKNWENGYMVVLATKPHSRTGAISHIMRKLYYKFLDRVADISLTKDATGFGLYDKRVIDRVREINDPYPYFRGLIDELGYKTKTISFVQPRRSVGISKNNFSSLYDLAMLGVVSHSIMPIRLASLMGIVIGLLSFILALVILFIKIFSWDTFAPGMAVILIFNSIMFGVIITFIGILGEYVRAILVYVRNRPIVVEKERVNFD
jgi:dolichol-phosphate mannosyltransferase